MAVRKAAAVILLASEAAAFAPVVAPRSSPMARAVSLKAGPPASATASLMDSQVARRTSPPQMAAAAAVAAGWTAGPIGAVIALASAVVLWIVRVLNTPSRVYDREQNTVGREYDAWTSEGILEYYWGEHIHLGWYAENERSGPFYGGRDFIEAKYTFIDKMLEFSKVSDSPAKVLDVGCGIGGTSRYLAKKFPSAEVTGITISPEQQRRATDLAAERGISNAKFELCDALDMKYPDNSFDFVWACESGDAGQGQVHEDDARAEAGRPDRRRDVVRARTPPEFNAQERKTLDYLYGEWTHPYFISIEEYGRIMEKTGRLTEVVTDDWAKEAIPAWRHSVWVGVWDPWPVVRRPTSGGRSSATRGASR